MTHMRQKSREQHISHPKYVIEFKNRRRSMMKSCFTFPPRGMTGRRPRPISKPKYRNHRPSASSTQSQRNISHLQFEECELIEFLFLWVLNRPNQQNISKMVAAPNLTYLSMFSQLFKHIPRGYIFVLHRNVYIYLKFL